MAGAGPDADLIDIRLLNTFLVVAQELSFTRASARLYLSQQAVSSQVRALEASLNMQLFRRTTRSVHLTPSGKVLQSRMQPLLQALDEAIVDAREVAHRSGVVLAVGHTASAAHRLLPRAAGLLSRTVPELHLRSEQYSELGLRAAVAEGRVHLGVGLELTFGGSRLARQEVGREPWCAVVGPEHPLADRQQVAVAELAAYEWLTWPRSSHPGHWRAVHRLAARAGGPPTVTETWLSIAHGRLTTTEAVMLQPLSFTLQLPQGMVPVELEQAPVGHFSAVWSMMAPPPCLNQVLSALTKAAEYPWASGAPGRRPQLPASALW
ncbi:LysR family transcriptional regulator [Streptomyces sp. NPDC006475]|uniref:LysR family transcriptional regulator n=1 Tax=Streptomyces sp. NPDC006475 TaxID=3155719 RepID=UPI0033A970EB